MFSLISTGRMLDLQEPVVMGIINCTPDSFYSGSRVQQTEQGLLFAEEQVRQGARVLDLGGQSTRPGSTRITAKEERDRVIPLLSAIRQKHPALFLSVDTFYAEVAQAAIDAGADMINDISAGTIDPSIRQVAARSGLPYVLMHMRGTPQDMKSHTTYEHVTRDVVQFLQREIDACRQAGIDQLVLDPGIGFAKRIEHTFAADSDWRLPKINDLQNAGCRPHAGVEWHHGPAHVCPDAGRAPIAGARRTCRLGNHSVI